MKLIQNIKNNKLKYVEYFLLSLLTIFLIFPMKQSKYILILLVIPWAIITYLNDKKGFIDFFIKRHFVNYTVYIWLLFNIYVNFFTKIIPVSFNFIATAFALLLYLYYVKKEKKTGLYTMAITALSTILIVNVTTITAVTINNQISRLLSTSMKETFNYFGIGSYSYVYGLVFVSLALLMLLIYLKKNWKIKLIILLLFILSVFCIYKTAFLIALILLIFGILLVILRINTIKKLACYTLVGIVLCFVLMYSGLALKFFTYLSKNTDNHYFQSRFNDIVLLLKKEDISKTDDLKLRLNVYKTSIYAIKESPIVGMLNEKYLKTNKQSGGHSAILDEFARYGFLFSIPFFTMMFFCVNEIRKSFKNNKYRKCWFIIIFCAIILGFINTMVFPTLMFLLFSVVPSILKYCELAIEKESEN